ncbi:dihydrodipicolinate synthase family protein [Ruficoccus amylovorans]|uniref:Dihydrodipicolinate synthase family protein n=1 Tax=Ruficoccus amylovorans TaxID=1804625 RepID=A0A842HJ32_9BACT|nr:dihydrodipicolinate synthase family protein [Ruficoccus amylovorans]MBC2596389.1 dihydrodipicolinate synthase family protein [Ruficoccus amylovorans]
MNLDLSTIERGVWPAMLTPFKSDLSVDFDGLASLVDFYVGHGVHGLLSTCWSSETEYLSFDEALEINRQTVRLTQGRIPVAATPHAMAAAETPSLEERIQMLFDIGVTYVVLVAARLAEPDQSDEELCDRLEAMPWDGLGIYESPSPYHRLLSAQAMSRIAATGRFFFHKDTSCNIDSIRAKVDAVRGTPLRFYNAHSPTLLDSLRWGGNGYCGVGANFHPEVYVELCDCVGRDPSRAESIQHFLNTVETMSGNNTYPSNAKVHLQRRGVRIGTQTRITCPFTPESEKLLDGLALCYEEHYGPMCR